MVEISKDEYEELQLIKQKYEQSLQNTNQEDNTEELFAILKSFSKDIESLTLANEQISDLVTINDRISFQTNLLSINAKIEASRAGEAGKGFAIVADEVKKLAASSKHSTEEIGNKIKEITDVTSSIKNQSFRLNALVNNTSTETEEN